MNECALPMPDNQPRAHFPRPHPFFWTFYTPATFCPNHLRPGTRQLRTALCPRAPERIKTDPQPASLASPVPVHGHHNEAHGLWFDLVPSASCLTLVLPCAALHGVTCLLFLRICEEKLPWWQSFLCLHISLYLIKTNLGCVLKQSHSETPEGRGSGGVVKGQHTL